MIINQIAGGGKQKTFVTRMYIANGTFVVPDGINKVFVRLFGGGGGSHSGGACGGGGGGHMAFDEITVTPGEEIPITIGAGGDSGYNGGATSFGTYLSANGGGKGTFVANSRYCHGGSGGTGGGGYGYGGNGGAGSYGGGGGGSGSTSIYGIPAGNGGAGGTYGGGGGGGGGDATNMSGYYPKAGGNGGAGGTYGGNGGAGGNGSSDSSVKNNGENGTDGTNTMQIATVEFPGAGTAGIGSDAIVVTDSDGNYTSKSIGGAGGGGGGYGGNGGNGKNSLTNSGGGGGGYGGNGGDGVINNGNISCGGGGGGYGGNANGDTGNKSGGGGYGVMNYGAGAPANPGSSRFQYYFGNNGCAIIQFWA